MGVMLNREAGATNFTELIKAYLHRQRREVFGLYYC
jgi:hypothetical protein